MRAAGADFSKDDREAARLYKLSADQGNSFAQNNLGNFYQEGRGDLPKDDAEAVRYYKLASDQNNSNAQCNLGFFTRTAGVGFPRMKGKRPVSTNCQPIKAMLMGSITSVFITNTAAAVSRRMTRKLRVNTRWLWIAAIQTRKQH